ncbi:MAG: glycosyltransferase family 4 protein [Geodermatophilaceae bacterium]|nr:glycosyltransferase family 4 protein [Geodermatophilaceae bacterium]
MPEPAVAYVLKGYPRMSELFIASEIWRLEQLGLRPRLYVVKPADEPAHHQVVDRIAAIPSYLPPTTPLSGQPLLPWLRCNLGAYRPALTRMARRHPLRFARAFAAAAAQSIRARKGRRPRTVYVKEFLQAVELADRVLTAGGIGRLHAHFAHGTTTIAWLASMLSALPFSFTGHAKDIYRDSLNPAGLLARKMRAADFVVTCTAANREHLLRIAPGADVALVYHGLNADFARLVSETNPAVRSVAGPLRVTAVGRLVPKKGFDVLVEAIALLCDGGLDVTLTIAGEDGPAGTPLREQIADAGLGEVVQIKGPLSQGELLELYRGSDVFALACRVVDDGDRDGIPNVMVEAMAAGLPVVSTTVSGIPELVRDGSNGLLVPAEDPCLLAGALLRLATDRELLHQLGRAAAVTVAEEFDGDLLAKRMGTLFAGPGS